MLDSTGDNNPKQKHTRQAVDYMRLHFSRLPRLESPLTLAQTERLSRPKEAYEMNPMQQLTKICTTAELVHNYIGRITAACESYKRVYGQDISEFDNFERRESISEEKLDSMINYAKILKENIRALQQRIGNKDIKKFMNDHIVKLQEIDVEVKINTHIKSQHQAATDCLGKIEKVSRQLSDCIFELRHGSLISDRENVFNLNQLEKDLEYRLDQLQRRKDFLSDKDMADPLTTLTTDHTPGWHVFPGWFVAKAAWEGKREAESQ